MPSFLSHKQLLNLALHFCMVRVEFSRLEFFMVLQFTLYILYREKL